MQEEAAALLGDPLARDAARERRQQPAFRQDRQAERAELTAEPRVLRRSERRRRQRALVAAAFGVVLALQARAERGLDRAELAHQLRRAHRRRVHHGGEQRLGAVVVRARLALRRLPLVRAAQHPRQLRLVSLRPDRCDDVVGDPIRAVASRRFILLQFLGEQRDAPHHHGLAARRFRSVRVFTNLRNFLVAAPLERRRERAAARPLAIRAVVAHLQEHRHHLRAEKHRLT